MESNNNIIHPELKNDEPIESLLSSVLVAIHEDVDKMCVQFRNEARRSFHVTPKSFLDFVQLFMNILKKSKASSELNRDRLINGLQKLEETKVNIAVMKEDLILLQPKLEEKAKVKYCYIRLSLHIYLSRSHFQSYNR